LGAKLQLVPAGRLPEHTIAVACGKKRTNSYLWVSLQPPIIDTLRDEEGEGRLADLQEAMGEKNWDWLIHKIRYK
jgi:hypothetical protein